MLETSTGAHGAPFDRTGDRIPGLRLRSLVIG